MPLTSADITARIARNLQRAREAAGLTQKDAGIRLDPQVRGEEIRRWENGQVRPREPTLLQLARIYGVDVAWLYGDHDLSPLPSEADERVA